MSTQRFEYDVIELKEKLISIRGSAPTDKLRGLLNQRAAQGWQMKALIDGEVSGAFGARAGWMVIFERPTEPAGVTPVATRSDADGSAPVPAGWHPDPNGSKRQRWWDGRRWTDRIQ